MAKLRVEIPIPLYTQESANNVAEFFRGFSFTAQLLEKETVFDLNVSLKKETSEYGRLEFNVTLSLSAEIDGWADIGKNRYYIGTKSEYEIPNEDGTLERVEVDDCYSLDELVEFDIKKVIIGFAIAMILANPKINARSIGVHMYLDEILVHRKVLLRYNIHNDAVNMYPEMFTETLSLQQTWRWVYENTSIYGQKDLSPMCISALSYILDRDYHEAVLYGVIGLESIYAAKNEKGIAERLKKRISLLIPSVDEQRIKELYKMRSKVVHGEVKLGISFSIDEVLESDEGFEQSGVFATAILLSSIRKLVAQNATSIKFVEKTEFSFE